MSQRDPNIYGTDDFNHDIAAYLGDVKLAPRLWRFIRRQIAQELLNARQVYIGDIGTFSFKFRPGRQGPTNWEDDRLIIKFKASAKLQEQFHASQDRGRGKALLEKFKKVPRIRNSVLEYKRVAARKPTWYTKFGAKIAASDQLRHPGSASALAQPPIPSSSAGQGELPDAKAL